MKGVPASRVLVDLDCKALNLPGVDERCDFLYVDEDKGSSRVAPIEIKSGGFKGSKVAAQLKGGAAVADGWIPPGGRFRLIPILVHGGTVHRLERKRLRAAPISIREYTAQVVLIRCGASLGSALNRS